MRRIVSILSLAVALSLLVISCSEKQVPVYAVKDSCVFFDPVYSQFSLRGKSGVVECTVNLKLYGPAVDYDREIAVEVVDSSYNNAVQGTDFTIERAYVPAGELSGKIILKVQPVTLEIPTRTTTLAIRKNKDFSYLKYDADVCRVAWSDEYMRPSNPNVWQSWFYFFSNGYSKNYHKLLVEVLGDEVERAGYTNGARNDPELSYRIFTWWYAQAKVFYDFVQEHDLAHPDDPYMHSDDFEVYTNYSTAVGKGTKPDTPPTILSTIFKN